MAGRELGPRGNAEADPLTGAPNAARHSAGLSRRGTLRTLLATSAGLLLASCGSTTSPIVAGSPANTATTSSAVGLLTSSSGAPASSAVTIPVSQAATSAGTLAATTQQSGSASAVPGRTSDKLFFLVEADASQVKIWQQIVDAFHQTGHASQIELSNPSNIYAKFDTLISSGTGPDLFRLETKYVLRYAGAEVALSLDPYVGRSGTIKASNFFAATWGKNVLNGHLYALPINNAPLAIFYNADLFRQAGVPLPPTQWGAKGWDTAAFLDAAHKLTNTSGAKKQWFSNWSTQWTFVLPWVWGNGGHLFDATISKVLVDTPEVVSAFQWLADLTWKEHVQPTPDELDANKSAFTAGTLAIQADTEADSPQYIQEIKSFQWNVAALPVGTAGVWTRDPANSVLAWQGTKQPDATWELAQFVGEDTAQLLLGLGGNGVPARISAAKSPTFLKQANGVDWQVFVDAIEHEGIQPITDNYPDINTLFTKQTASLWANQQSAQQVMTTLKPLLEQLLKAAKYRRDRTGFWQTQGWTASPS